jgi:hypothetical protein
LAEAKRILKWQRDPEGMRVRILAAAKQEFDAHGLAGARVDKGVQLAECALQSWRERRWIDVATIKV